MEKKNSYLCGEKNNAGFFFVIEADSTRAAAVAYCEDMGIDWDTTVLVFPIHTGTEARARPVTAYEVV